MEVVAYFCDLEHPAPDSSTIPVYHLNLEELSDGSFKCKGCGKIMNKLLKEARKKEDDENVLAFPEPKAAGKPPGGHDWLRGLPAETRFVAKPKGPRSVWLEGFGIGHVEASCILLATDDPYKPGISWKWVDSANFSAQYELVQVLPALNEELDNQPEKDE